MILAFTWKHPENRRLVLCRAWCTRTAAVPVIWLDVDPLETRQTVDYLAAIVTDLERRIFQDLEAGDLFQVREWHRLHLLGGWEFYDSEKASKAFAVLRLAVDEITKAQQEIDPPPPDTATEAPLELEAAI